MINIHALLEKSEIYGPGKRFVIWVQGCSIHCEGCWNIDTWSFQPNLLMTPIELANKVLSKSDIEGITILGGEPLNQSEELIKFVELIVRNGLTVILYTGYSKENINSESSFNLCKMSDIVIYGPYIRQLRDTNLYLRGSSNQVIEINSKKYGFDIIKDGVQCEIEFYPDGEIMFYGYPDDFSK